MSFLSPYYIGTTLNLFSLLLVASSGAFFALKTKEINLGGEGQVYLGGFVAAIILGNFGNQFDFETFGILGKISLLGFAFLASLFSGMLLMLISILLKKVSKIDVLLSSFLVSSGIIPIINFLISGPFRDKSENLLATETIQKFFRFPVILKPSKLNISLILILLIFALGFYFLYFTKKGKVFRICGSEKEFALYSGFSVERNLNFGLLLSGGLYGLCGFLAVTGTYYMCHSGFYSQFGWNGLTIALIANRKKGLLLPVALFLSFLLTYAEQLSLFTNFNSDVFLILEGVILFFITSKKSLKIFTKRGER